MMVLASFLVTLILIARVHELGHIRAATLCGVWAGKSALGFGPELVGRTSKSALRWSVNLLPLGSYVRFVGDENSAPLSRPETGPVVPAR